MPPIDTSDLKAKKLQVIDELLGQAHRAKDNITDSRRLAAAGKAAQEAEFTRIKANEGSWVSGLGLEEGSFLGNRVNDMASIASGIGRLAGDVASLPVNTLAALESATASEAQVAAFNRVKQGTGTAEDDIMADQLRNAEKIRGAARNTKDFFDISKIVNQSNRDSLNSALGDEFELNWEQVKSGWKDGKPTAMVSGLAGLLYNAGEAAVTNPAAAREYILENAPQLFVGAAGVVGKAGLAASNLGYAADNYSKGIENYAKENGGQLPPEEDRQRMAVYAASLALAEQAGDMVGLGVAKLGGKAVAGAGIKNTAKAASTAGLTEAATEGYQTFAESEVTGEEVTAKDIYTGAVIGAVAGAGLSGGVRALAEITKNTPEHEAERITEQVVEQAAKQVYTEAVASNDVTPYLDPQNKQYDPSKAVGVLLANAQREDTAPEAKEANLTKAGEIVAQLEEQYAQAQEAVAERAPEQVELVRTKLAEKEAELAATDPNDVDTRADLEDLVLGLNEYIADLTDKNKTLAAETKLSKIERQLNTGRTRLEGLTTVVQPTVTTNEMNELVTQASSPEVATRIMSLAMTRPELMTGDQAKALADDKSNALTTEQRSHLRVFSDARVAENVLTTQSKVSQEVLFGSPDGVKNVGIAQYRTRITTAIQAGSKKSAETQLGMLEKFSSDHTAKADTAIKALREHGLGAQIIKTNDKGWIGAPKGTYEKKDLVKAGGLDLNSGRLVLEIKNEAIALRAAHAEMKSATDLKFGVQSNPSQKQTVPPKILSTERNVEDGARLIVNNQTTKTVPVPNSTQSTKTVPTSAPLVSATPAPIKNKTSLRETKARVEAEIARRKEARAKAQQSAITPVSPASSPASPVAADAAPATAPSSASTTNFPQEAAEQQGEAPAQPPVAEAATGLRVFAQKVKAEAGEKMQSLFGRANPVVQFLKQELSSDRYKTPRPLVETTDFLTAWKKGEVVPSKYLVDGVMPDLEDGSNPEKTALKSLYSHLNKWAPMFGNMLAKFDGGKDFLTEDLMQYLVENVDGKMNIEQNIKTAMAYSMYSWTLSQSNAPAWMTKKDIGQMHGKDKDSYVSEAGIEAMKNISGFQDRVIFELGDVAVQALGLKTDVNAPADLLPKLKSALGSHIMMLMASPEIGLVERVSIPVDTVNDFFKLDTKNDDLNENGDEVESPAFTVDMHYIKFVRDSDTKTLTGQVRQIRDANIGARGVVDRLFGTDKAARIAGTKPVEFKQEFAKNTRQKISEAQAKVVQETMNTPHTAIPAMQQLATLFGRENILKVAGYKDLDNTKVHIANRDSVEAQNMNLENQFDQMWEMLSSHPEGTGFYVEQSVWKNFRAGFSNQSLNQQTSKIHRFMFARPGWESKITLGSDMEQEFRVAVAMMLGEKTDQQRNAQTLEKFVNVTLKKKPEIMQAVEIIRTGLLQDDASAWTDVNKAILVKAASGEGMGALQALVAMAQYEQAKADGATEFTTTLLVGVDGKTNGPMLTHLALGAADSMEEFYTLLNRGGFYSTEDGQADHFSQWYEGDDSMDLYEDLGSQIVGRVQKNIVTQAELDQMRKDKDWKSFFKHYTQEQLDAIQLTTNTLVEGGKATKYMRNLTKTPLTSFAFGSSIKKSVDNMKSNFVASIYANFESLAEKGASDLEVQAYVKSLNALMNMGDFNIKNPLNVNATAEALLEVKLKDAEILALHNAFDRVIGKSVEAEMKSYFHTFNQRRTHMNNTVQAAYQTYEAAYAEARIDQMNKLMDNGEIAYRMSKKNGVEIRVPRHDMTVAQDNALRDKLASLMPVMHTNYSIEANDLASGLFMAKSKTMVSQSPLYANTVRTKLGKVSSKSQTRVEQAPGVAGVPYAIHSTDSSIMHQMLGRVKNSLNVHDEGSNGVTQVAEVARSLNQATAEVLLNYSPAREAQYMLERMVSSMAQQIRDGVVHGQAAKVMLESWAENYNKFAETPEERKTPSQAAILTMTDALMNSLQADTMRLTALSQLKSVDQYVWEGGQAIIDQSFRDKATAKLKGMSSELNKATLTDLDFLIEQFKKYEGQDIVRPSWIDIKKDTETKGDVLKPTQPAKVVNENPMSQLGKSRSPADPKLKAAFEKQPQMTLVEAAKVIGEAVTDDFSKKLMGQLQRSVRDDISFNYVTADTLEADVLNGKASPTAAGWYTWNGDHTKHAIYVLSPEFTHSYLVPETMIHELTHASLHAKVETATESSDEGKLVKELTTLMELAKDYVADNAMSATSNGFDTAFENIHEFIAYGMTNRAFQQQVLEKISMKSKNRKNALITGMQAFIESLVGLIFGRHNNAMMTGMEVMVMNVAGLLNAAEQQQPTTAPASAKKSLSITAPGSVRNLSTMDVFLALGQQNNGTAVSAGFSNHLQNLLQGIVTKLHGPFGSFKDVLMEQTAQTPEQAYADALATGAAPYAFEAIHAGISFTEQEAFVAEQVQVTVREAMNTKDGVTSVAYRELSKLYDEVRNKVTVEDFYLSPTPTLVEIAEAQAIYNFIFGIKMGADGRSDYLSRFAALGLANEQFNTVLSSVVSRQKTNVGQTFTSRMHRIFEQVLNFIAGKMTNTQDNQTADVKLVKLVEQLVKIEAKKRAKIVATNSFTTPIEDMVEDLAEGTRKKIDAFTKLPFFQQHKNGFVRAGASLTSALANDRTDAIMESFNRMRDQHFRQQHGVMASLVNEFRGSNASNVVFHFLLRASKYIEGIRKDIITNTGKVVLGSFVNNGDNLTHKQKEAISAVYLRTDLASLLDRYNMKELTQMVNNPARVKAEIAKLERDLAGLSTKKFSRFYVNSAKALGYYKAVGKVTNAHMLMNAGNIARLYGTGMQTRVTESEAVAAESIIDQLTTLYALSYTRDEHLHNARDVLKGETARTDGGNGVEMILKTHKQLQEKSKELLFADSQALHMKGYTTEIYDPYMDVVVAGLAEGAQLVARGYEQGVEVDHERGVDPLGEIKHIYHLRDGGLQPHLTGVFSYTGEAAKGKRLHSGNVSQLTYGGQVNASNMASIAANKRPGIQQMFMATNFDPSAVKDTFMAPVLNANGDVANYRYLMTEKVKDDLLKRDNRPEKILGAMAGSIYDKVSSKKQNRRGVEALKEQYDAEFAEVPESYLTVGPKSTDPELREIWRLLPEATKQDVREVWGTEGMKVRVDLLDMNFGYRKLSLADTFENDQRGFLKEMFVELTTHMFHEKAALRVRQAEDMWQTIVKMTKGNLVVRSWSTFSGNLRSNWSQLVLLGVNPLKIAKSHRVAFKGAWAFKKDSEELFALQHQLDTKYLQPGETEADLKHRIARLKDSMNRNPVKPLIDAGLMPTIVEDINPDDDIYSYKSRWVKSAERYTDKINPNVVKVAKFMLMTEDSTPYKVMSYGTQISDFLARYTLYEHATTRRKNPLSHEAAVQLASDAFINYDVPTHRMVQYANDSGLVMFTKYYMRIQKMLMRIYRESPGKVMAMIAAESMMGAQPTVLDSSMLTRWGNPVNMGALDYPGSLDALATVRIITSPFRSGNPAE